MQINCYIRASDQNYDIAIEFSYPDFLKDSNNLAIMRRRFHAVTLTFDPLIVNVCSRLHRITRHMVKLCTKFERNRTIYG